MKDVGGSAGLRSASAAGAPPLGQPGAGGGEPRSAEGERQGQPPAGKQDDELGQGLLAGVMGKGRHGQLVEQ